MYWYTNVGDISLPHGITSLDAPDQEAMVIDSLTLEQYHEICYWDLSRRRSISLSTPVTVKLGAVIASSWDDQVKDLVGIAFLPDVVVRVGRWYEVEGEVMKDGI
jgi:hypothetical protein